MHDNIDQIFKHGQGNDYVIGLGDFRAVVGEGSNGLIAGCFSLGGSNDWSDVLIEFCKIMQEHNDS